VHHILTGTCSSDDRREYSRFPTFLQDRSEVQTAAVREMLENGTHATAEEIATAEKINASYVSRVLPLKLTCAGDR
jgi:hypothetical protein